ncbi:DUF5074 domain-containing protein [Chitinophaga sp. MM2321]|uniref:DUF5074 domain-containing protein n=1 Tax=Chitinophaga sp. MM2321 TaxID=3137178 RepID=UPI0032D58DAF
MRIFSRKLQLPIFLAVAAVFTFAACQKDNVSEIIIPTVVDPGLKDGKDTIAVGDTRILSPQLANSTNGTYQWLVNGVIAGTDSTFTFTPTESGDYTISFSVSSGNSLTSYYYRIKVTDKYDNGFYLINEGWFGHEPGDVNFYRNGEDTLHLNIFQRENAGKTLGTTTEYGAVFDRKLYLISKEGPFVVADASSMKETGRVPQLPANGNSFVGVDANRGLIATVDGVYPINLQTLAVGAKISGITGQVGGMIKTDNHILVMSEQDGIIALNTGDFSIAQKLVKADVGFARTADGSIWAGGGKFLYAINPQTLEVTTVDIPFDLYGAWGAWNAGMLTASTAENALFLGKTNAWGAGGREIYKYQPGNAASLQTPFITLPVDRELIGAGVRYNPANNSLVVTGIEPGYGDHYKENTLFIYDASSAATKKTIAYTGFFFPAMPAFN